MANTVISLKKSSIPSATPPDLANGEIAINYADGILYYKAANGSIASISTGTSSFGTVNASGTLLFADALNDVLDICSGNNIVITGDAINDRLTIDADLTPSNNYANASFTTIANGTAAFNHANAAYDKANSSISGGFYQGNNGDIGSGFGDIFRVHTNTLTENVTIHTGNNAIAAGPLTIATGRTLTIQSGSRVVLS